MQTLFINLDHRTDRKTHILEQLNSIGIDNPIRMHGIYDPKHGAVGCTKSHIRCLEYAIEHNFPSVLICEDDALFTKPWLLQSQIGAFLRCNVSWDVLIVGGLVLAPVDHCGVCWMRVRQVHTTTAYVVHSSFYQTLLKNFRQGLALLEQHPTMRHLYAIDMQWKPLQQSGRWYCVDPLSVVQQPDFSDVEQKSVDYSDYMLTIVDMEKHINTAREKG